METCVKCNERPVFIKKRKICRACYQADYRRNQKGQGGKVAGRKPSYQAEIDFLIKCSGKKMIYLPARFDLGSTSYSPDFYDAETGDFIEIVGTRQAYHINKKKFDLFRKTYPTLNLRVVCADGSDYKGRK